jgi:transcription antitermination factor NusG
MRQIETTRSHPRAGECDGERTQWFAACIRPRHEKKVDEQLRQRRIESFLPLYRAVHRWKDRRKAVHLPLFPGYLFVRIPANERLKVLQLPGVTRFVGFEGSPTAIPEVEIQVLQRGLVNNLSAEPHPYLKVGRRVRVRSGPLSGAEGTLIRKKGALRLVLSFDAILKAVSVEVDAGDVEPIYDDRNYFHQAQEKAFA